MTIAVDWNIENQTKQNQKDLFLSENRQDILIMLKTVFSTLTVAMRYEPANAKCFATDVSFFVDIFFFHFIYVVCMNIYVICCNLNDKVKSIT